MRRLTLVLILLVALLPGCRKDKGSLPHAGKDITPLEYQQLKDPQRIRHKDVVVRVPSTWGGVLLPFDPGPYKSPVDKATHGGDLSTLIGLYNQAAFELEHPRVKIEYVNFDMWSDQFRSVLAVAIAAKRAPAYYIARDLPQTIEQGMYADLTDLMKKWDQYENQPEGSRREGTVNGRIYTMAANEMGASPVIRYRKDWFREAGIFNERGEPGPRSDWTWEDFRKIAKKLTDPKRGRYGFSHEMGDWLYNQAYGIDSLSMLYIPDPTGKHTWVFNDKDPELIRSLQAVRDMYQKDKSVSTSVTFGWFEWHQEFEAGHAAMIPSFSAHIPSDSLNSPFKLGKDKPFKDTVGMVVPPHGPYGMSGLKPITNPIGFDPTLSKEQLEAAFEWVKSYFYGDVFLNRVRASSQEARIKGKQSLLYQELLVLPYNPKENLLDKPLEEVFPRDYIECYKQIRASHAPPLPREFGLREPPTNEWVKAIKKMYEQALTTNVDLKQLVANTARLMNQNYLNFGGPGDGERLHRYINARTDFYRKYYPEYYEKAWKQKLATYMRVP
jgi:ABC-type glycerol-3-phosphate transport system substrate-binding protein